MNKNYILFWQAFSLPIAYVTANAYLNVNNYITQLNSLLHTRIPTIFSESVTLALIIFLTVFMTPNLYVYISLYSLKEDLVNGRIQRDIHITPHEEYIEINNRVYTIKGTLDKQLIEVILVSMFPLIIDYSSLTLMLLSSIILAVISIAYVEGPLILVNPYLRLRYHVFVLQSENKTLYIIMEKEKAFEKPKFSDYVIDWYYDHLVLIGFKYSDSRLSLHFHFNHFMFVHDRV
jgi:hypothetical protein